MCGRFALVVKYEKLVVQFDMNEKIKLSPRYNIAPSQPILAVTADKIHQRHFVWLRWGLIPPWQKEENISSRWINARIETIDEKPIFRTAFHKRRCLIPATAFYEWEKTVKGKVPFAVYQNDFEPFAFAGLWEHWEQSGIVIDSATILTQDAQKKLSWLHDRIPVIINKNNYNLWLNQDAHIRDILQILKNEKIPHFNTYRVSSHVNNPRFDDPECLKLI